jgi:virginiamycin B lyase
VRPTVGIPAVAFAFTLACAQAATVSGSVKGPDGAAFRAAFVQAENVTTKITVSVLSDVQGHYRIESLPAGTYRLSIRAIGYDADPRIGIGLSPKQDESFDFALEKRMVRWDEISISQGKQLFPPGQAKDLLFHRCSTCHAFQNRIVPLNLRPDGWRDRIGYMKALGVAGRLDDQQIAELSAYLASLFGPDSVLPKSPAELQGYEDTVRPVSDDALDIVYVEYEMPGPHYFPFNAAPDKNGKVWISNHGWTNRITRLDPSTGEMKDFPVPENRPALIHCAVPASDGAVWIAESGMTHKLGKWDPGTQEIVEFEDIPSHKYRVGLDEQDIEVQGGTKHTVRVDRDGNVWSSGIPLTMFDPKTEKFTHFDEAVVTYDVKPDKNGDVWFTFPTGNRIGRVDGKTRKVAMWEMPTPKSYPRRMAIGPDGMIWVGESAFPYTYSPGKIARFDPDTETFEEYSLPGPDPSPYAMEFDEDGYLWYDSHYMDVVGRFDTRTGDVIEYPFPHSEISMREFFRDDQGRLWYGSNPNNKVGYFYFRGDASAARGK